MDPGNMEWQEYAPTDNGLYEYRGPLYALGSDTAIDCDPYCRLNVRRDEGPRVSIWGEDGKEYDIIRTRDGMWRGPVGPVHIPLEDARRED